MEDEEVREALKRQGVTITFDHEDNNSSFDATDLRFEMKALTKETPSGEFKPYGRDIDPPEENNHRQVL
jgi:hypothetical protein